MTATAPKPRPRAIPAPLLLSLVIFALGIVLGMAAEKRVAAASDLALAFAPLLEAAELIQSRYIDPVDIETLVDGALAGMVKALDDAHSDYIRPRHYQRSTNFSGEFSGIGVFVETDELSGDVKVLSVMAGSPAETSGVSPGDVFHAVDGTLVSGYTQVELSTLVPGPRGTRVIITFRRDSELITLEIERETMVIPNVEYALLAGDIAHIKMLDFNDLARAQFGDALEALDINQRAGLIFDLRGNAGGTLASAIEIGSALIEDGILLRQAARDQAEIITRTTGGYAGIQAPIALLVDATTASAAEVLAGALQDHQAATIIGQPTYGKGTVQNILPLENGGGIRLTVRRWLTPEGSWIHQQGIRPDIMVEPVDADADDAATDALLQRAIAHLASLGG